MTLFDRWRPIRRPAPPTEPVLRWLVLQQGPNPSTDYYIRPRAEASGCPVAYRHLDLDLPTPADLPPGTRVVIVRYLTPAWAEALQRHQAQLAGIVYFMDDELLDPQAWQGLPAPYRQKLQRYCGRMHRVLTELVTEYWGSTAPLCERHADRAMQPMPPLPLVEDAGRVPIQPVPGEPVQIFYHGTSVHIDEMRWLRPVIAEVLSACPLAQFEVIGDHEVNRLFRDLPRTRVLHPMGWPNYLSHCRAMRGHIGLAPLLPGAFNAARSSTRYFDIERCRAVAIAAATPPYLSDLSDRPDRRCLDMAPSIWSTRLIEMVQTGTGQPR
ncbi:hypothetical protein [Sphaerotilus sp.]|uniref:hypothetical protein n=1 Tax=Sphaerotilus sp. TaxID=2093942 RepID=UPI0034E2A8C8